MNIIIMTAPPRQTDALRASLTGATVLETIDTDHRGSFYNAISAFNAGCTLGGPFTILQDDVMVCKNFVSYVERLEETIEREQWIVNWFDVTRAKQPIAPVLTWEHGSEFYYSQAVTYASGVASRILNYLQTEALPLSQKDDRGQTHGDDMWIRAALTDHREMFLKHLPSLVQHIGQESLVAPGMRLEQHQRVSRNFVGVDFDVMQWPRVI